MIRGKHIHLDVQKLISMHSLLENLAILRGYLLLLSFV